MMSLETTAHPTSFGCAPRNDITKSQPSDASSSPVKPDDKGPIERERILKEGLRVLTMLIELGERERTRKGLQPS